MAHRNGEEGRKGRSPKASRPCVTDMGFLIDPPCAGEKEGGHHVRFGAQLFTQFSLPTHTRI